MALGGLGTRWELEQIALRLWPSATALQDVLTALFVIIDDNDIAFDDIAAVRIAVSQTPFDMHGGFSTYSAKFEALLSAHYVASVYLRDRTLTLDQFEPACYDNPALRAFAAEKVTVEADSSLTGGQAIAEVTLRDGTTLSGRCDHPLGTPENPLTQQQIEDKFRTYAARILSAGQIDTVIDTVNGLEDLSNAGDLVAMLRGPANAIAAE